MTVHSRAFVIPGTSNTRPIHAWRPPAGEMMEEADDAHSCREAEDLVAGERGLPRAGDRCVHRLGALYPAPSSGRPAGEAGRQREGRHYGRDVEPQYPGTY